MSEPIKETQKILDLIIGKIPVKIKEPWCKPQIYCDNECIYYMYGQPSAQYMLAGWKRQAFPACCGLSIVSNFSTISAIEEKYWEEWYTQAVSLRHLPAIGAIPMIIKGDFSLESKAMFKVYDFLREKSEVISITKNPIYTNHAIETRLFLHPKSTLKKIYLGLDGAYMTGELQG